MHTSLRLQPRADPTASSSRRNAALGKVRRSIFGCERKDAARLVHTHCASPSGAAVAPAGYDVKARTRQALGIPPPLPGRSRKGSNNYPSDQLEDAARRECRRLVEAVDSPDGPASLAALLSLRDGVASATSSLRPSHLLDSGFVQVLVPLIARPDCSPASAVATALEVLCWSLGPAATRELTDAQLISLEPLVPTLLSYISAKLDAAQGTAAGESLGAAVAATGSPRAAPTFPSCSLHPAAAAPTCSIAGNWDAGTFFAVSAVVKLARLPRLPATIIEHGGLQVLVRALNAPAASMLPQLVVFALYKLVRSGSSAATAAASTSSSPPSATDAAYANLWAMVRSGAFPRLCQLLCMSACQGGDQAMRDTASCLLLDIAQVPGMPRHLADNNHIIHLVTVLRAASEQKQQHGNGEGSAATGSCSVGAAAAAAATSSPSSPSATSQRCNYSTDGSRMYAVLILARLANHCSACQMDAVRDGVVEPLVSMMADGTPDEQAHAARLLAILAQAVPTHCRIKTSESIAAVTRLLRDGNGNVREHAASVLAILAQNPDTHFQLVGWGIVPCLVPLLSAKDSRAQSYSLAALLLLCLHEPRHAAVVSRAGAVPALVGLVRQGHGQRVREYAAAVISCLCKQPELQVEAVAAGAIPALARLVCEGEPDAVSHACEALVTILSADWSRATQMARNGMAAALTSVVASLSGSSSSGAAAATAAPDAGATSSASMDEQQQQPYVRHSNTLCWALLLLKHLSRSRDIKRELRTSVTLAHAVARVLRLREVQPLVVASAASTASPGAFPASLPMPSAATAMSDSSSSSSSSSSSAAAAGSPSTAGQPFGGSAAASAPISAAAAAAGRAYVDAAPREVLPSWETHSPLSPRSSDATLPTVQLESDAQEEVEEEEAEDVEEGGVVISELQRAQVHAAWLVACLAEAPEMRQQLAGMSLERPLAAMLRRADRQQRDAEQQQLQRLAALTGEADVSDALDLLRRTTGGGGGGGGSSSGTTHHAAAASGLLQALDSNVYAAVTAALHALSRGQPSVHEAVAMELVLSGWCGARLELPGLGVQQCGDGDEARRDLLDDLLSEQEEQEGGRGWSGGSEHGGGELQ